MRIASIFLLMSLSAPVLGINKIEKYMIKHQLQPLVESDYWRQNPGVLPYEECKITDFEGHRVEGHKALVGVGGEHHHQDFTLFCYSKKHRTAFLIPITLSRDVSIGGVDLNIISYTSGKMFRLNKLAVKDIFGEYTGPSAGFGVITSVSGALLKNDNDKNFMVINESWGLTALEFHGSTRFLHVGNRALKAEEVYSPFYIQRWDEVEEEMQLTPEQRYGIGNFDEHFDFVQGKIDELRRMSDDRKYNAVWLLWIHHLQANFDPNVCPVRHQQQRPKQKAARANPCIPGAELDTEFLSTLRFKKIK